MFVAALREALLRGEVDFAVHSLKDLPTAAARGPGAGRRAAARGPARRAGRPRRADLRAAAATAPAIGTGSPRRMAQLNAYARVARPARSRPCRSAATSTRGSGTYAAVSSTRSCSPPPGSAASAGSARSTDFLPVDTVLPAPGQGALAIECAAANADLAAALAELDDPYTRVAVTAERSLLAALEAGCSAPVGALADLAGRRAGCQRNAPARRRRHHRRLHAGAAVHHRSRTRRRTTRRWPSVANSPPRCSPRVRPVLWGSEHFEPHRPAASDFRPCPHGHVTFLGAGPGDPGLLTLRAVEALAERGRPGRRAGRARRRTSHAPCAARGVEHA